MENKKYHESTKIHEGHEKEISQMRDQGTKKNRPNRAMSWARKKQRKT
jgi:hypothetical protein